MSINGKDSLRAVFSVLSSIDITLAFYTEKVRILKPVNKTTASFRPATSSRVRIVLRIDRDMEYVHMKDMRAACKMLDIYTAALEPVNANSSTFYSLVKLPK
ncbi:MAG: hypothetical protein JW881_05985 [Spirochaetales bacterium]|nr:hypothetical protein [Spirochaetales bacterium]